MALLNTELDRKGPGLLLRDIVSDKDEQVAAVVDLLVAAEADIVLLLRFDWDLDGAALNAFADRLFKAGLDYPHRLALRPNTGLGTGLDLDGDGRFEGPRDAQGYGLFPGQNGMALLSRLPIDRAGVIDLSDLLWRDLPGAEMPVTAAGGPYPSEDAQAAQRLSSVGHWAVPIRLASGEQIAVLAYHASPPVFDGPEDANGLRNADEQRLWRSFLESRLATPPPKLPVVLIGGANVDPNRGEGRRDVLKELLSWDRLQDPEPQGDAPVADATVDWRGITDPPYLRVDYVLPDQVFEVLGSGVLWPPEPARGELVKHGLVWVDLVLPPGR
ncbi:MAG: endonuclease/exonuclease/phosphatase family protein [Pseudomonadota bacterium]